MKGRIYSSKDYDLFNIREDNRDIQTCHLKRVTQRLEEYDDLHLHPIIVNSDMEIVDGQHRFIAAKSLGRTIYYVMDNNFDPYKMVSINTTSKKWGMNDYLKYWCNKGKEDYLLLKNLMDKTQFGVNLTIIWTLSQDPHSGGSTGYKFKSGLFKFMTSTEIEESIQYALEIFKHLREIKLKPLSILTQSAFHLALSSILNTSIVKKERMVEKVKQGFVPVRYGHGCNHYIRNLVEIYNYRMRNDILVYSDRGEFFVQK